ncbi:hypothetical protein NMY22_g11493 [Coprinellus aureogranulatus]|nr:hypothetical protein NMY22_g11493 [Coprinellus aureogranulatus]
MSLTLRARFTATVEGENIRDGSNNGGPTDQDDQLEEAIVAELLAPHQDDHEEAIAAELLARHRQRVITVVDKALPFDPRFIRSLQLETFHPGAPRPEQYSNVADPSPDVLVDLGRDVYALLTLGRNVGPGVSKAQFRFITRQCRVCRHYCYKEREAAHTCPKKASRPFRGGPDDLVAFLLSRAPNTGLSLFDLRRQIAVHECPSTYNN